MVTHGLPPPPGGAVRQHVSPSARISWPSPRDVLEVLSLLVGAMQLVAVGLLIEPRLLISEGSRQRTTTQRIPADAVCRAGLLPLRVAVRLARRRRACLWLHRLVPFASLLLDVSGCMRSNVFAGVAIASVALMCCVAGDRRRFVSKWCVFCSVTVLPKAPCVRSQAPR